MDTQQLLQESERARLALLSTLKEKQLIEAELRKIETLYRKMIENSPTGMHFYELKSEDKLIFVGANPAADRILGVNNSQFIGKTIEEAFPHLIKTEIPKRYRDAAKRGIPWSTEQIEYKDEKITGAFEVKAFQTTPQKMVAVFTDITKRRQEEENIFLANERLNYLLSATTAVIYTAKPSGNYVATFISQNVSQMTGYKSNEFIEEPNFWFNHLHPEDQPWIEKEVSKIFEKDFHGYEYRFQRKDGIYIWLRDEMKLVRNDKGEPFEIVGYWTDITESKLTEEALKKNGDEYRLILDSSPIIVFFKDREGRFIRVNKIFAEMLNMSTEKFTGKTVFDIYSTDIARGMTNDDQQVMESGKPMLNIIEQYESKQGKRWVQTDKIPTFDVNGKVIGLIGFAQDITERKRADEALRESEERFRTLIEHSHDAITLLTADGTVLYDTPSVARILGYSPEERIGRRVLEFVHPDERDRMAHGFAKFTQQIDVVAMSEVCFIHKDGTPRWIKGVHTNLLHTSAVRAVVVNYRDITERKRAEEALRESEEKYRKLIDQSPDGIFIIDLNGKFLSVNKAMLQNLKFSNEEFLSMNIWDIISKDYLILHKNRLLRILTGESINEPAEYLVKGKDGEEFFVEILSTPYYDKNNIVGLQGIARNINERKRAEEEILQRAKQLTTLLTTSQVLTATLDQTTILQTITESAADIMQLGTTAIYLLEGENLYLGATTPPLPLQFPETFRHASLADHPHIRETITTGLPVIIPDTAITHLTNAERAISDLRGLRTILYVPLIVGEKTVGTLILGTVGETRNFTESQIDLYRTLSNHAAIAIENARLLSEVRQRNKEMEIFESIIKSTTTKLNLQTILDKALEGAIALTGLEGGTLYLIDNEKKVLDLSAAHNTSKEMFDELSAHSIGIGDCLCGKATESGKPLILWDNASGSEYATHESVRNEAIRFHAAFPIIAGDNPLGVLCVFARNEFKPTQRSLEMVNELCRTVALAIENAQLFQEVRSNVEKLKNTVAELTDAKNHLGTSYAQLRQLSGRLQTIREDESTRIAREIHDELGQTLTGIKMDLSFLEEALIEEHIFNKAAPLIKKLYSMSKLADGAIQTIRKITTELRPAILDSMGISAAIEWQAEDLQHRTGIKCKYTPMRENLELDRERSTAIFRILQESLTNIVRHAKATKVNITFKEEADGLVLEIQDNGKGISASDMKKKNSFGLLGMKERAWLLSGTIDVQGVQGKGTTVKVKIPLK